MRRMLSLVLCVIGCAPSSVAPPSSSRPESIPTPDEDCARKKAENPGDGCVCGCPPETICCGDGPKYCAKPTDGKTCP